MQSLFNQLVSTSVQALLYLLSLYPSQPFPAFSLDSSCISVFPVHPRGARELCPDILQQNVWELYNHSLS